MDQGISQNSSSCHSGAGRTDPDFEGKGMSFRSPTCLILFQQSIAVEERFALFSCFNSPSGSFSISSAPVSFHHRILLYAESRQTEHAPRCS
jgi:hypothetical protein